MIDKNDNRILNKPKKRIKEILGYEIELKLNYFGKFGEVSFSDIKHIFADSNFAFVDELDDLSSIFNFDYYGYWKSNNLIRLFVLIYHPSTNKFWLRRKEDYSSPIAVYTGKLAHIARKEETIIFQKIYNEKAGLEIIKKEEKRLGYKIVFVGSIVRQKRYFMVEKKDTTRTYSVALDRCRSRGRTLNQLEIEYKWIREKSRQYTKGVENIINKDLKEIQKMLLNSKIGGKFVPTYLTKWEWLLSLRNKFNNNGKYEKN